MDAFLLISIIVVAVVLLLVNIYLLAIFIHPDDKGFGTSIFPKIVVVLGLTLAWGQVFMVPLDVANSRGDGGGINMDVFWKIVLIADAIFLVFLIPFAIFRYEGDEEAGFFKRLWSSLCYTFGTVIFFALVIGISYAFLSKANIPLTSYGFAASNVTSSTGAVSWDTLSTNSIGHSTSLQLDVSFPVYIMAFFSFIGWIFFLLFGGLGLFAIPMDLINDFRYRPKKKTQRELANSRKDLQAKAAELMEVGQNLKRNQEKAGDETGFFSKRRVESKLNRDRNKYKATVMAFEKEYEIFKIEENYQNSNPIIAFLKLVAGILLFIVAIIWWIHILISSVLTKNGFRLTGFLNNMLVYLQEDGNVGFIATAIFMFLCLYLVWAVTKGNVKFGIRIPFLFSLHPMKRDGTLMNSFLFNVWLILVSSIACIQFVTNVFSDYVRLTTVDMLFGIQIKYMRFYEWFYENNVFEIAFLVWSGLSLFCLCICGRDKPQELKKIEQLKREIGKK